MNSAENNDFTRVVKEIKQLGKDFGFAAVKICAPDLSQDANHFNTWLQNHFQGDMHYLERYYEERLHPNLLVPNTKSIICCRLNYTPPQHDQQTIASFAHGKNYPKYMRQQLKNYAKNISLKINELQILRIFSGSAPLLEKVLAVKSGIGWQGKNSLILDSQDGSYFFLGEIFVNLELPVDTAIANRCGTCSQCIAKCPTQAIIEPYKLDARRCIAYLTIEHHGAIPVELRPLIGTRIFGCDACQCACPWNQSMANAAAALPQPFAHLTTTNLAELFLWDEATFTAKTQGSAIARLGYERWLRNIAVALGNAPANTVNIVALQSRMHNASPLVQEHIKWALEHTPR